MDIWQLIASLGRALRKLRGGDPANEMIPKLEEALDVSRSAFPQLSPVAKFPAFRAPALDPEVTLGLALDFMGRVVVPYLNVDLPAAGAMLREMSEDREMVIKTRVEVAEILIKGKSTAVKISGLEIRIATPLLQRLYEGEAQSWENVANLLDANLAPALDRALELRDQFETSLDDVRAYTFSIDSAWWLPNPILTSGMSVYVHWLGSMFYIALGERRDDFDEWLRYGRVGAVTDELFKRGPRTGDM